MQLGASKKCSSMGTVTNCKCNSVTENLSFESRELRVGIIGEKRALLACKKKK